MQEKLNKLSAALHAVAWTLLACSLLANYALWNGKIIRPEWVQDYVSVLSDAQKEKPRT
jgi:hypothetical protein